MQETHYFTDNRSLPSNRKEHTWDFLGKTYLFTTDTGVFSKGGVDRGTEVFLKALSKENITGRVLDIGCGYGVIGIVMKSIHEDAEVICTDVNPRAVELAGYNAKQNGVLIDTCVSDLYTSIEGTLDCVLTNPPIRAGKSVVYSIYEGAFCRLNTGGKLYVVIRKQQGAQSSEQKLVECFGNCEEIAKSKGYRVLKCIKNG